MTLIETENRETENIKNKQSASLRESSKEYSARNKAAGTTGSPVQGKLLLVPTANVGAWEKNPRKYFDEEALEELAKNIKVHGILQPIVVCDNADQFGDRPTRFTVIMGERRRRAAVLAGLETVPIIIRQVADEGEMLFLAMSENSARRDTNPLEDAQAYAALIHEFGYKQAVIGEQSGHSQSMVAKILGLLRLPEDAQALIGQGKLKTAHGVALLRFADFPKLVSQIARTAVEEKTPSKVLETGVPFIRSLDTAKLLKIFDYATKFDTTVCQKCPFNAYRSDGNYSHVCLKPDHYNELQKGAIAEKQRREAAALDQVRKQTEGKASPVTAGPQAAPDVLAPSAPSKFQDENSEVKADPDDLPSVSDMPRDSVVIVRPENEPPGCTAQCACRAAAMGYQKETVTICTDRSRYMQLCAARDEAKTKDRNDRAGDMRLTTQEHLDGLREFCGKNMEDVKRATALTLSRVLRHLDIANVREVALRLKLPLDFADYSPQSDHPTGFLKSLAKLDALTQMLFVAEIVLVGEATAYGRGWNQGDFSEWFHEAQLPLSITPSNGPVSSVESNAPGTLSTLPGITRESSKEDGEIDEDAGECTRCGKTISGEQVRQVAKAVDFSRPPSTPTRSSQGILLTPPGALYCAECAPDVALCRICGCSDECGCIGGCYWVEKDLCSNCASENRAADGAEDVPLVPAASEDGYQPRELICASCGVNAAADTIYCRSCDPAVMEDLVRA